MGSPSWYLWLEGAPPDRQKINTKIRIGKTAVQKRESRALAEELYHQKMLQLAADRDHLTSPASRTRTLNQQIAWHRTTITPHNRGAEREREILARLEKDLGHLPLVILDRPRVQEWMRHRIVNKVSPTTVNREVDVLKAVLREAVPTYLKISPIYGMKRLRSSTTPHRRVLQPAEEKKLLRALAPEDRAMVIMGLDTLCRLSDILDLRRQDDKGDVLWIRAPKGGRSYAVPVSVRLRKALKRLPLNGEFYFPGRREAKTARDRRAAIRQMLKRTCKALGIPYGRKQGGITFHWATRRTGATRMIQRGIDVRTVQEIGNWKQADVLLQIYSESNAEARKRAVEAVSHQRRRTKAGPVLVAQAGENHHR